MAKSAIVETEQPKTMTLDTGATIDASYAELLIEDSGKDNVSTKAEDNTVPLIYVLQSNSPQVDPSGPDYVKGAVPGSIWFRNTPIVVNGNAGIIVQMVYWFKNFVEWVPRNKGGGWVAIYDDMPNDAVETPDPQRPQRVRWVRPNGNEIVETRYHVVLAHFDNGQVLPFMIPMSSTANTVSKNWTMQMNNDRIAGKRIPSWARMWKMTTKRRQNAAGTWFTWEVEPVIEHPRIHKDNQLVLIDYYSRGRELNDTCSVLRPDTQQHLLEQTKDAGGNPANAPF